VIAVLQADRMRPALVKRLREDAAFEKAGGFLRAAGQARRKLRNAEQGRCLDAVSVVHGRDVAGRTHTRQVESFFDTLDEPTIESAGRAYTLDETTAASAVRVALAGALGQRRFAHRIRGGGNDRRAAALMAARLVNEGESVAPILSRLRRAVGRDLSRPKVARAIHALAAALMAERRIAGLRAEQLIRAALMAAV
jgi:hypothetical protein